LNSFTLTNSAREVADDPFISTLISTTKKTTVRPSSESLIRSLQNSNTADSSSITVDVMKQAIKILTAKTLEEVQEDMKLLQSFCELLKEFNPGVEYDFKTQLK
jgi:hypothetical protein